MKNEIAKPLVWYLASKRDNVLLKNALIDAENNGNIRCRIIIGSVKQIVKELPEGKKNDLPNIIIAPKRFKKNMPE